MHQSIFISDEVGHVGVFPCIRPEDRVEAVAVSNYYRPVANLEENGSLGADYGPQEGASEVPRGEPLGFDSLTNVLTNGDNPACHGFQCQSGKGYLFTNPLLDNISPFLARNFCAEPAMRGTACSVRD